MYCFQLSLPFSRPKPDSLLPPNASATSMPPVLSLTLATPASLPVTLINACISAMSRVNTPDPKPCGTPLALATASSKVR